MNQQPHIDPDDVFSAEGEEIYLRCVNDDGVHMGDLRIATAEAPLHADTLVNAANAGMRVLRDKMIDRTIGNILGPNGETP